MSRFRVTHNGTNSEYFDNCEMVEGYIAQALEPYQHLSPKEIYRGYGTDNKATEETYTGRSTIKSVVIWQYRTLYTEVFMIEEIKYN
jgi:hypothetical protein